MKKFTHLQEVVGYYLIKKLSTDGDKNVKP